MTRFWMVNMSKGSTWGLLGLFLGYIIAWTGGCFEGRETSFASPSAQTSYVLNGAVCTVVMEDRNLHDIEKDMTWCVEKHIQAVKFYEGVQR